jgi:phage FluMu protein Com
MVRIITLACPNCGTIVAGNVVENHREMKCPGRECEEVLQFSYLADDEQQHILEHRQQYAMED